MSSLDAIIDHFVDHNNEELSVALLQTVAPTDSGGRGYRIALRRMIDMDGYEHDAASKTITLDSSYWAGNMSAGQMADNLRDALQVEILNTHASLVSRIGWGTTNVVVGVIEVGAGFVGIIVPEPGTTVAGVAVFALGVNSIADGFTQLAGVNNGHGVNVLATGAGALGGSISEATGHEREVGERIGRNVFAVSSIAVGTVGSIKVLKVKDQQLLRMGVRGRPGGAAVGRVDLMYPHGRAKGMTIFNISNNSDQYILRLVTHDGRLMVNGRIVARAHGRVLDHERSPKAILKGLIKLCAHGARQGL